MSIFSTVGSLFASNVTPSSIDQFKSTIAKHQGMARPNRFAIVMAPPNATLLNLDIQSQATKLLSGGGLKLGSFINDPRDMTLLCESCTFPGRSVRTADFQTVRNELKIPVGMMQEDVTFKFHLTNDYYIKKMFDRWLELVLNVKKYRTGYLKDYATDVVIQQLNAKNLPVYGIRLKDAYPISVNSVDLDNTSTDSTAYMNVQFTYRDYEPEGSLKTAIDGLKTSISNIKKLL